MRWFLSGVGVVMAALCTVSEAAGQRETERYIPIGESPGLSGVYTYLGPITRVDSVALTITVGDSTGPRTIRISPKTRIWLDRTKLRQTNLTGRFADLQAGRRVEVKYQDAARREAADWVKVEIAQP